jgi:hypothetical protein
VSRVQCRATAKHTQAQCRKHAIRGRDVCRLHGGRTPRGPASVHWKGGRYSRHLPARLAAQYEAAAQDPELTELRSDIALTDARIIDLLQRVDTGEAGAVWRAAKATLRRVQRAQARGDPDKMRAHLDTLQGLIERGAGDYAAWREIGEQIEARRRLCESEHKRMVLLQQCISAEKAMVLLEVVIATIRRHVPDRQALAKIAHDIGQLAHVEPRPPLRIVPPWEDEVQGGM